VERRPPLGGQSATRGYQRAAAPAPEGAEEGSTVAVPPPLRGGLTFVPEHQGYRPAAPDSTRGYRPAPLRGERMLRRKCHGPPAARGLPAKLTPERTPINGIGLCGFACLGAGTVRIPVIEKLS